MPHTTEKCPAPVRNEQQQQHITDANPHGLSAGVIHVAKARDDSSQREHAGPPGRVIGHGIAEGSGPVVGGRNNRNGNADRHGHHAKTVGNTAPRFAAPQQLRRLRPLVWCICN